MICNAHCFLSVSTQGGKPEISLAVHLKGRAVRLYDAIDGNRLKLHEFEKASVIKDADETIPPLCVLRHKPGKGKVKAAGFGSRSPAHYTPLLLKRGHEYPVMDEKGCCSVTDLLRSFDPCDVAADGDCIFTCLLPLFPEAKSSSDVRQVLAEAILRDANAGAQHARSAGKDLADALMRDDHAGPQHARSARKDACISDYADEPFDFFWLAAIAEAAVCYYSEKMFRKRVPTRSSSRRQQRKEPSLVVRAWGDEIKDTYGYAGLRLLSSELEKSLLFVTGQAVRYLPPLNSRRPVPAYRGAPCVGSLLAAALAVGADAARRALMKSMVPSSVDAVLR